MKRNPLLRTTYRPHFDTLEDILVPAPVVLQPVSGIWDTASGQMTSSGSYASAVASASHANYTVSMTVQTFVSGTMTWNVSRPMFRYQNASNYYAIVLSTTGELELGKRVNGEWRDHLAFVRTTLDPRQPNVFQVTAIGPNYTVWVNGVKYLEYTDTSPLLTGGVGVINDKSIGMVKNVQYDPIGTVSGLTWTTGGSPVGFEYAVADVAAADFTADMRVQTLQRTGPATWDTTRAVFRFVDPQNYYAIVFMTDGFVELAKRQSNVWIPNQNTPALYRQSLNLDPFQPHDIRIKAVGARIQVWIDGVARIDVTDQSPILGHGGLGIYENASRGKVDNVVITPVSAPPPVTSTPPSITTAASVTLNAANTTAVLAVRASAGMGGTLSYFWRTTGSPSASVAFGPQSDSTNVQFLAAGTYEFEVVVSESNSTLTAKDRVTVIVRQIPSSISVTPQSINIAPNSSQQLGASGTDQFGIPMALSGVAWSVSPGRGTVSPQGVYTAPGTTGTATITATLNGLTGASNVTIQAMSPTLMGSVSAILRASGKEADLSVTAVGNNGVPLQYTWSSNQPNVAFTPGAAGNAVARFPSSGAFRINVTIDDGFGLSVQTSVTVDVAAIATTITVSPDFATVAVGGSRQFQASAFDQFGAAMSSVPFQWSKDGVGTVDANGLFTQSCAGSATIRARVGGVEGAATIVSINATIATTLLDLAPFKTKGNQIVSQATEEPVRIQATSIFGFETDTGLPEGVRAISLEKMLSRVKGLGFNTIRVPFQSDTLNDGYIPQDLFGMQFHNPDLRGKSALYALDRVVQLAGEKGLAVILDYHEDTRPWNSSDTRNAWISGWEFLAQRYLGNPTVIGADLYNEPHKVANGSSEDVSWETWRTEAITAANKVLDVNPNWLIIVEGVLQGADLRGAIADNNLIASRLRVSNRLVYSPHAYPVGNYQIDNTTQDRRNKWDDFWGSLYRSGTSPVLLGEFSRWQGNGVTNEYNADWMRDLTQYLNQISNPNGIAGAKGMSFAHWALAPQDPPGAIGLVFNNTDPNGFDDWSALDSTMMADLQPLLTYEFKIELGAPVSRDLVFSFTTRNGTAVADVDYQGVSGRTILIGAGQEAASFFVGLKGRWGMLDGRRFFVDILDASAMGLATIDATIAPTL